MSYRKEALHALRALDLIVTREDVRQGKPDPEIYLLAAQQLNVPREECLVLEDSPSGVRAAVAAGMNVIGIATPFTSASLHESQLLERAWLVDDPDTLLDVVTRRIEEHNRSVHQGNGIQGKGER